MSVRPEDLIEPIVAEIRATLASWPTPEMSTAAEVGAVVRAELAGMKVPVPGIDALLEPLGGALRLQLTAFEGRLATARKSESSAAGDGPALVEMVQGDLDALRDQLDEAFAEVVSRVVRLEGRLGVAQNQAEVQADTAQRSADTLVDSVARLEEVVGALAADRAPVPGQREEELAQEIAEDRAEMALAIELLRRDVAALRSTPVEVDTNALEAVAQGGALRNAADIANVRREVVTLAEAVHLQDKGIGEVQATLDWIKQRLLNR